MFLLMMRLGAASPVRGINRLDTQHSSANSSTRPEKVSGVPPFLAAMPPAMVPSRMATKVAPSTQRIAGRQFAPLEMVGKDAVFDRAEQRADHPEAEQRDEQDHDRMGHEARDRETGNRDFDELQPLRDDCLVETVGHLAAERRQEEIRCDEHRAGKRDQRFGLFAADPEQDQEHERVFQEIVVERRKELRPEQRRKAPRQHQGGRGSHGTPVTADTCWSPTISMNGPVRANAAKIGVTARFPSITPAGSARRAGACNRDRRRYRGGIG